VPIFAKEGLQSMAQKAHEIGDSFTLDFSYPGNS
jgi:hypothetical protein